jgi:hypothetical protein
LKTAICTRRAGITDGGLAEFILILLRRLKNFGVGVSLERELVVFAKQK